MKSNGKDRAHAKMAKSYLERAQKEANRFSPSPTLIRELLKNAIGHIEKIEKDKQ